jgi:hypothetical protein
VRARAILVTVTMVTVTMMVVVSRKSSQAFSQTTVSLSQLIFLMETTETSSYKRGQGHKQAYGQTSFLVQQGNKSYRLKGVKRKPKTKSEVDLIAKKVVAAARNLHGIQEIKPKDPVHTHHEFLVPSSNPSNPPYTVSDTDKGWTCTCMDFLIRRRGKGEDCKHITETKALV